MTRAPRGREGGCARAGPTGLLCPTVTARAKPAPRGRAGARRRERARRRRRARARSVRHGSVEVRPHRAVRGRRAIEVLAARGAPRPARRRGRRRERARARDAAASASTLRGGAHGGANADVLLTDERHTPRTPHAVAAAATASPFAGDGADPSRKNARGPTAADARAASRSGPLKIPRSSVSSGARVRPCCADSSATTRGWQDHRAG